MYWRFVKHTSKILNSGKKKKKSFVMESVHAQHDVFLI